MVIYSLPIRSFIEKLPNKSLMTQPPPPWSADRQASTRRDQTNTRVDKLVQSPHRSDLRSVAKGRQRPGKFWEMLDVLIGMV
jgi:hypothetical protein